MDLIERVKRICLTPQTEWSVIAGEHTPVAGLITGYVVPLSGVAAIAGLAGGTLIGWVLPLFGTYRTPIATGLGLAVYGVVAAVIGVLLLSLIINALAPTFSGQQNSAQALKVAVYSFTPVWVAGVFQIVPTLGVLVLLGSLYGLYLLYLGLPQLMHCPKDKAVGYTALIVVCAIVIDLVLGAASAAVTGLGRIGARGLSGVVGGP